MSPTIDPALLLNRQEGASEEINALGGDGLTPLQRAAQFKEVCDVEDILENPSVVLSIKNNEGNTALHLAAAQGKLEMVDFLVSKGANIDIQNHDGFTPFRVALINRQFKVAEYLFYASINTYSFPSNTNFPISVIKIALAVACEKHQYEVVEFLTKIDPISTPDAKIPYNSEIKQSLPPDSFFFAQAQLYNKRRKFPTIPAIGPI